MPAADASDALPAVRTIPLAQPFEWLRRGWLDLHACFGPSLLHGLIVALGGLAIVTLTLHAVALMPGALSGFLLIGPILCTGLYELSRRRAAGERPRLGHALDAWRRGTRPLVALGLLLFGAATAWVLVSALLFQLFVPVPLDTPLRFLRYTVAGQGGWLFLLWLLAGGLGAALVFALTVVSAPLLLDRRVGLRAALLTSVRAVGDNPAPMALWATLIMLATAASMATLMIGFVFAVPVIGHATWHAYRDVLDVERPAAAGVTPMEPGPFGLTEAQVAEFGMTWGVGAFIAFMLFIIWKLARDSKAGRFGTFILFFVLAFGILGFVAKQVIQWLIGVE